MLILILKPKGNILNTNLFPARCSYEFALVVRTLFVRVRTSANSPANYATPPSDNAGLQTILKKVLEKDLNAGMGCSGEGATAQQQKALEPSQINNANKHHSGQAATRQQAAAAAKHTKKTLKN